MDYVELAWVHDLRGAGLTWDTLGGRLGATLPRIRQGTPRFRELPDVAPAQTSALAMCETLGVRQMTSLAQGSSGHSDMLLPCDIRMSQGLCDARSAQEPRHHDLNQ